MAKQNPLKKLSKYFKKFDQFGDSVNFNVRDGERTFNTMSGTVISLLIFTLILLYGITKLRIMLDY